MRLNFIKRIKEHKEKQLRILRDYKRDEIKLALINFYLAKDLADGVIDIPYFIKAENVMNQFIKTNADIDKYYANLQKYKKTYGLV